MSQHGSKFWLDLLAPNLEKCFQILKSYTVCKRAHITIFLFNFHGFTILLFHYYGNRIYHYCKCPPKYGACSNGFLRCLKVYSNFQTSIYIETNIDFFLNSGISFIIRMTVYRLCNLRNVFPV